MIMMRKVKSNLELAEELADEITNQTPYKAHVAYINALCFAQGNTITIKKTFFQGLQIVYDNGELDYYTRGDELSEFESEVLGRIEKLTNTKVVIRDERNISFGGR